MPAPTLLSRARRSLGRAGGELGHWPLLRLRPWLEERRGRRALSGPGRQILVVQLADIGDLVLSGPFLRALRASEPAARIVLITAPHTASLARGCPHIDDVAPFDYRPLGGERWKERREGCPAWWREAARLRRRLFAEGRPDAAFSLRTHGDGIQAAALIMVACSHAPRRVGHAGKPLLGRLRSDRVLTHPIPLPPPSAPVRHEVERQFDLLRAADFAAPPPGPLESWATAEGRAEAGRLWETLAPRTGPRIGLGIGAGQPRKRWPHFAALADLLETRLGAVVVLVGGPDDAGAAALLAGRPGRIDLAGRLPLPLTAAVLEKLDLFIGNDSGPAHLAAAAGIPVISLFGPEDPARWAPWSRRGECLRESELALLPPERVLEAARARLAAA